MKNTPPSLQARNDLHIRKLLYELSFSLNLSLIVLLIDAQFISSFFATAETKLKYALAGHFHSLSREFSGYAAITIIAAILSLVILICVRLLSREHRVRDALLPITGASALLALPAFSLTNLYFYGPSPVMWLGVCLIAELILVTAAGSIYLARRWTPPALVGIGIVTTHLVLWSYFGFGTGIFLAPSPHLVFPAVSFLAVLTWASYVRSCFSEQS